MIILQEVYIQIHRQCEILLKVVIDTAIQGQNGQQKCMESYKEINEYY